MKTQIMEQYHAEIDEYRFKVANVCGFSELVFKKDGSIFLIESSPILESDDEIPMNSYENLYEFLTKNLRPLCRDELLFKIKQKLDIDSKMIKIPHDIYKIEEYT